MNHQRRSAFTLFQLLIVLALLLVLFALLLPAVAKVRLAAARMQSQNNLKQIALAVHNYHDVNNRMPSGNDANGFSAAAYLLPYIEQDNLFKLIDFKKSVDDKANAPARQARIKTLMNPLDPVQMVTPDYGPTNYLFSAGTSPDLVNNNGVFFQISRVRFAQISDGLSNTIMAGDTLKGNGGVRAVDVRRQHVRLKKEALKGIKDDAGVKDFQNDKHIAANRCASWMDGRFLQGTFNGRLAINDAKPDVDCAGLGGLSALRTMQDGVSVGMCDGSVRFVSSGISLVTWRAAITRDGGEVLGNDW
jgi:type II secretory pathway pseudopilin PulG